MRVLAIALVLLAAVGVAVAQQGEPSVVTKLSEAQEAARSLVAQAQSALLESSAQVQRFRPYNREQDVTANLHAVAQIRNPKVGPRKEDKLAMAFNAVNSEVMARVHEINTEQKWIKSVQSLITIYTKKHGQVSKNMKKVKKDIRSLLRKKKQIQNAIIQRELKTRVKMTSTDLTAVNRQLRRILKKAQQFKRHQTKLKKLLTRMKGQLSHLRGKPAAKN